MSNFPSSLPSATPANHGEVVGEVRAIATEMGLDPSGPDYATVAARLDGCYGIGALKANQSVSTGAWSPIQLAATTPVNVGGTTNPTNTRIQVPNAGLYLFTAQLTWTVNGTGARNAAIVKNSGASYTGPADAKTVAVQPLNPVINGGFDTIHQLVGAVVLAANDYVELWGFQSSGAGLNAIATANANQTVLSVARFPS